MRLTYMVISAGWVLWPGRSRSSIARTSWWTDTGWPARASLRASSTISFDRLT